MRPSIRRADLSIRPQRDVQSSSSPSHTASARKKKGFGYSINNDDDDDGDAEHDYEYEYVERNAVVSDDHRNVTPFVDDMQINWKGSFDCEGDVQLRPKERSVFVGCIPEGIENIDEVLHGLMDAFLERFDFAPLEVGDILAVRIVKDFAFLELASDKVAQIVLAANQLDVFEWGINGFHFNIEGCKGTFSSVRPLVEYVPLRPARVIFVGNIPKPHWKRDYIEEAFSTILWGSDGKTDMKPVVSVYLLPESSDAYVELVSEYIADALVYKCTKNNQLLKDIGEDVFICRDANSPPMMSRHKIDICPQRSLFIGVSVRDEYFKIDHVRRVFDDILPLISRKINQYAYLEYISVQPGKDYAFFQFNSEMVVDAIMDEYVENTQIFVCKNAPIPLTYIILRPPEYIRPGARYNSTETLERHSSGLDSRVRGQQKPAYHSTTDRTLAIAKKQGHIRMHGENSRSLVQNCRKYVDEPAKKPDCIISIGASPPPSAMWNGPGASSSDTDSLVVIEGLPKGYRYKLLRGALNELFERALSNTGLLEVGMLVVGYLDRDDDLDIVACLPNADFAYALLSLQTTFIVCGHEIRLSPKDRRKKLSGRSKSTAMPWVQDELLASSDEETGFDGTDSFHTTAPEEWNDSVFSHERKRCFSENVNVYTSGRTRNLRRKFGSSGSDVRHKNRRVSPMDKEGFHGHERDQDFNVYHSSRTNEGLYWDDNNSSGGTHRGLKRAGFLNFDNSKAMMKGREDGRDFKRGIRRHN